MARDYDDVRITYSGNVELARQYVSEARKYLGGLKDANTTNSAYRHITNSDGVRFFVANYVGQKQIEIWAPGGGEEEAGVIAAYGYALACTNSATDISGAWTALGSPAYSFSDALAGNGAEWKKYFYNVPTAPTSITHPTNLVTGAKSYIDFFPALGAQLDAASERPLGTELGTCWRDSKDTLFVYCMFPWCGTPALNGNSTHVYHNGKLVINNFTLYTQYVSNIAAAHGLYIAGAAAKRTATGLTFYIAAYVTTSLWSFPRVEILTVTATPTAAEQTRLNAVRSALPPSESGVILSFASEYIVDYTTVSRIATYQLDAKGSITNTPFMPIAINQAVTEARTIMLNDSWLGGVIGTGDPTYSSELVINFANAESIVYTNDTLEDISIDNPYESIDYSNDVYTPGYKRVNASCPTPSINDVPLGSTTWTHDSGLYGAVHTAWTEYVYPDHNGVSSFFYTGVPATSTVITRSGGGYGYDREIKAIVDYVNNIPVYAYMRPEFEVTTKTGIQNEYSIVHDGTATKTVVVALDGLGVKYFVSQSGTQISTLNVDMDHTWQEVAFRRSQTGWRFPIFDENGVDTGTSWFTADDAHTVTRSGSGTSTLTSTTTNGVTNSTVALSSANMSESKQRTMRLRMVDLKTQSCVFTRAIDETTTNNSMSVNSNYTGGLTATLSFPATRINASNSNRVRSTYTAIYAYGNLVFAHTTNEPDVPTSSNTTTPNVYFVPVISYCAPLSIGYYQSNSFSYPSAAYWTYARFTGVPSFNPVPYASYTLVHSLGSWTFELDTTTTFSVRIEVEEGVATNISASRIGVCAYKNTYCATYMYRQGAVSSGGGVVSNVDVAFPSRSVNYMTGAHNAAFYSTPFLISAIAVKVQNK